MVIEANHDIRMLEAGSYPYYLKRRILGNRGHLSNERSGQLIKVLLNNHIKAILLGHLSKENNFEALAYETVKLEISDNEFTKDVRELGLQVAKRDKPGMLINAVG
jgi:phosphoribosyl 1,2-cyclic phosphodiesterase